MIAPDNKSIKELYALHVKERDRLTHVVYLLAKKGLHPVHEQIAYIEQKIISDAAYKEYKIASDKREARRIDSL